MKLRFLWLGLVVVGLSVSCRSGDSSTPKTAVNTPVAPGSSVTPKTPPKGSWQRPFLFRVATKSRPFFVFGTIHLPDKRFDRFPPALEMAMKQAEAVYTEIPMDEATQLSVLPRLVLPEDSSLSSVLPTPLHDGLVQAFEQAGVSFVPFERMKPWAVMTQLGLLDNLPELRALQPLDALIYWRAAEAGKTVGGLETAEEQIELFDSLTLDEQVELLTQTYEQREAARVAERDVGDELLDAYLMGSTEDVTRLMREDYDEETPVGRKLTKRVFTDRNQSLTERIVLHVKAASDKTQLFAVGCVHVVGDDGIVAKLRAQGYAIERL
jgi:uncharacterized protein